MRWASDTMKSLYDGSAKDDLSSLGAKTGRESLVSSEPSTEPGVSSAVTVKLGISTCFAPMEGPVVGAPDEHAPRRAAERT